jgi:hypothetical protein
VVKYGQLSTVYIDIVYTQPCAPVTCVRTLGYFTSLVRAEELRIVAKRYIVRDSAHDRIHVYFGCTSRSR